MQHRTRSSAQLAPAGSALLVALACAVGSTRAECHKLTASDASIFDTLGRAVSVCGDVAVVGADHAAPRGAVYVYRLVGATWVEEQRLVARGGYPLANFGESVAVSGDVIVAGLQEDDDGGDRSGSAYVFRFDGNTWVEEQKLLASDAHRFDYFGRSVSVSGDVIVVGAVGDDDSGGGSGSAYVFRFDGSSWIEESKLTASDGEPQDFFGWSVSVSGDLALVAAAWSDDAGSEAGSAYMYRFDGSDWAEESKLTASDAAPLDHFGWSVSVSDDVAIVGAYQDDDAGGDSGSAYVFRFDGNTWFEETKLTASDGAAEDCFGWSVSVNDDVVVVGAYHNNDAGAESGSAYAYRFDGSTWIEEKWTSSDAATGDLFGYSVAVSGHVALVGAPEDDDAVPGSGSVYVFSLRKGEIGDCQGVDGVATLAVNGDNGVGNGHIVVVVEDGPMDLFIAKPAAGGNGKFIVHCNVGAPNECTITPLPARLDDSCFDFLIPPFGSGDPLAVWNNIGKTEKVGSSVYFGSSIGDPATAPITFLSLPSGDPTHLPVGSAFTLQAVILNPTASSPKGGSVTNAILMLVE